MDMRRLCAWCGAELAEDKRADALFCNERCQRADSLATHKQGRLDDKRNRPPCRHCGAAIPASADGRRAFCNVTCQRLARHAADTAARPRTCPVCGSGFLACRPDQACCSLACASERRRLDAPRTCEGCGAEIARPLPEQRFCRQQCQTNTWRRRKRAQH